MNRKPLVALRLLRSQIISGGKVFLPVAAASLANVSALAQDSSAAPANPVPAITFRVLSHRRINAGDHSVYLNRVAPPVLPAPTPAPPLPSAADVAAADAAEAQLPQKKSAILFFSATIYDRKVTEVRWSGENGQCRVFSNIDFNLITAASAIETEDSIYTLMLANENEPFDNGSGIAQYTSAEEWAQRFGNVVPAPNAFSTTHSEYAIAEGGNLVEPSEPDLAALDAIHVYVDANKQRLADEFAKREAAKARHAQWLKDHPPVPKDTVINYWKNNPVTNPAATGGNR